MNTKSIKLPQIIKAVLYILLVIFSFLFLYKFIFKPLPENFFGSPNWEVFEQTPTVGDPSIGLVVGYILIAISILVILFFSIMNLIDNPKKSLGSLLGFGLIIVIFLITWGLSSGEMTLDKVSESTSRFIGGSMGLLYVMGGASILAIIGAEIYSYFK